MFTTGREVGQEKQSRNSLPKQGVSKEEQVLRTIEEMSSGL